MTAEELANEVRTKVFYTGPRPMSNEEFHAAIVTASDAAARITGIGQEQYQVSPSEQRFESYSLPEMLTGLREELLDVINYAVMTDILVQRKLAAIEDEDDSGLRDPSEIAETPQQALDRIIANALNVLGDMKSGAYQRGDNTGDSKPVDAPPSPESVACAIKDACVAATTETLAAMFPEGGRYDADAEVECTIDVDLYDLAPDFDADGTDDETCEDADDAPPSPFDPLFGLTFTIDSLERDKGASSHTARMTCDGPVTHGSRNARIGFRVDHAWEAPVGAQYVLISKSAWESL